MFRRSDPAVPTAHPCSAGQPPSNEQQHGSRLEPTDLGKAIALSTPITPPKMSATPEAAAAPGGAAVNLESKEIWPDSDMGIDAEVLTMSAAE